MTDNKLIEDAARYAEGLAVSLHAKWFASKVPNWKPLSGDLIGLLTQIDNMTCGIAPAVRETCAAAVRQAFPCAPTHAQDEALFYAERAIRALPLDGLAGAPATPAPDMVLVPREAFDAAIERWLSSSPDGTYIPMQREETFPEEQMLTATPAPQQGDETP